VCTQEQHSISPLLPVYVYIYIFWQEKQIRNCSDS